MSFEIKKSSYLPMTKSVLQDVEEQDKEQIFCVGTASPGQPLQVIKNLRTCDDCHGVIYKL
ncbi:pentatricopeptide repeat-containing protein [Trifolium medium]|uniref:Pentatricopeptide repeat-containing protein n=1 Tax=Trifolium medium TaxID=97028 RepID=A0A392S5V9_9FABA|nr:pentatricopeptide repeat-containing protein [Trifolium medium]